MRKSLQIITFFALGFNVASAQQMTVNAPATGFVPNSLTTVNVALTQDFNTLAASGGTSTILPAGWAFSKTGRSGYQQIAPTTAEHATPRGYNYAVATGEGGSEIGKTVYSFGSSASTDRAFGAVTAGSTNVANHDMANIKLGAAFVNNTGVTITSLDIAYTGEQWRKGGAVTLSKLSFAYSTNATNLNDGNWIPVSDLDFTALHAGTANGGYGELDGNAVGNRTSKNKRIDVNIPNGATFWLRWEKDAVTSEIRNNDGLAIDDFSIIPNLTTQPVNLKSFNFQKTGSSIKLNWQTVAELNNDRFELSRSNDGSKFDFLTAVSGKGTSNEINNYSHTDFNPLAGTSYYQLKQIDKNGDATTYPLLVVKTTEPELVLDVRKASGNLTSLKIYTPATGLGVLKIYDITGKQLLTRQLNLTKGYNELSVDLPTANGSVHVFKLSANSTVTTKKVLLL